MVSTENKTVQDILAVQANELQALQKGSQGVRQDSSAFSVLPLATLASEKNFHTPRRIEWSPRKSTAVRAAAQ